MAAAQGTAAVPAPAEAGEPREARKLFVGGVPSAVTEADLIEYFTRFGEVLSAMVMRDRETGHGHGFAFVEYEISSPPRPPPNPAGFTILRITLLPCHLPRCAWIRARRLDKYEILMEVSGDGAPPPPDSFEAAGLAEAVLRCVVRCGYDSPTTGSEKTAAFCLPIISGLVQDATGGGTGAPSTVPPGQACSSSRQHESSRNRVAMPALSRVIVKVEICECDGWAAGGATEWDM